MKQSTMLFMQHQDPDYQNWVFLHPNQHGSFRCELTFPSPQSNGELLWAAPLWIPVHRDYIKQFIALYVHNNLKISKQLPTEIYQLGDSQSDWEVLYIERL